MPPQNPAHNIPQETQPHPAQKAFTPASKQDLWSGLGVSLICFIGFVAGGAAWLDPELALATVGSAGRQGQYELPFLLLMVVFPIFLIIAGYFFWQTWRWWRDTRTFVGSKQKITGAITHLWVDPPKGRGKKYYVGYRFGDGVEAYQQVQSRVYNRLTLGESVKVEYVPASPRLSRLNLRK